MREIEVAATANEAAKAADAATTPVKLKDDGHVLHFGWPDASTLMILLNAVEGVEVDDQGRVTNAKAALEAGQTLMYVLEALLGEDDWRYLRRRLMKRDDPLDLTEHIMPIMQKLVEEDWSGYPTEPSSDSSPSPDSTGENSTGTSKRKASTRSRSASTGS